MNFFCQVQSNLMCWSRGRDSFHLFHEDENLNLYNLLFSVKLKRHIVLICRFAFDIDLDAPKVRVPLRASGSDRCDSHFLLDFGHFTLHTAVCFLRYDVSSCAYVAWPFLK